MPILVASVTAQIVGQLVIGVPMVLIGAAATLDHNLIYYRKHDRSINVLSLLLPLGVFVSLVGLEWKARLVIAIGAGLLDPLARNLVLAGLTGRSVP